MKRFNGKYVLTFQKENGLDVLFLINTINTCVLMVNPPKITIGKQYFIPFVKIYLHESKLTKEELRNCLTKTLKGSYKFNINLYKDYHTYL